VTVDEKIRRLHKIAEEVRLVLQVCRSEQPEILHHAVGRHLLVEEPDQRVFMLVGLALLHYVNNLTENEVSAHMGLN